MVGDTKPNGSYTLANVDRIPRFVVPVDLSGKTTLKVSSRLFHGSPRSLLSSLRARVANCHFANDSSPSLCSQCSSSSTFEFHLCRSNCASLKIRDVSLLSFSASGTVGAPEMKSSTYMLLETSSTTSGSWLCQSSKCCFITPFNRKGEGDNPKRARVKRRIITSVQLESAHQWKRKASRSDSRIRICKNA